jgi:hypothetical protein
MDIVAYRCAASCEPTKKKPFREPLELAILRTDELMFRILNETDADEYAGWLSGNENFRTVIYPEYKANRVGLVRPEYLQNVREFMITDWNAKIAVGYEADDAIGMAFDGTGVICSIDKDFKQIPGRHYNFVTFEFDDVDDYTAELNFWSSMLIGDRVDNIPGVPGIGKVKAPRMLEGRTPKEMKEYVKEIYEGIDLDFDLNYNLLRILRDEGDWYEINENLQRKIERARTTETSSKDDPGEVPTINGA